MFFHTLAMSVVGGCCGVVIAANVEVFTNHTLGPQSLYLPLSLRQPSAMFLDSRLFFGVPQTLGIVYRILGIAKKSA
jgi:hypothetical protein